MVGHPCLSHFVYYYAAFSSSECIILSCNILSSGAKTNYIQTCPFKVKFQGKYVLPDQNGPFAFPIIFAIIICIIELAENIIRAWAKSASSYSKINHRSWSPGDFVWAPMIDVTVAIQFIRSKYVLLTSSVLKLSE